MREAKTESSTLADFEKAVASGEPSSELLKRMQKAGVQITKDII